jgi:XrtJ-associated TM-motif-TM protein
MKKSMILILGCLALLTLTQSLHAQTGCTNSPENPTAVLAVVGSAGALFTSVRRRLKTRRRADSK